MAHESEDLMSEPISLTKAAKEVGKSPATLRRAAGKTLKATKAGERSWVTTRQDVQDWLANPEYHKTAPNKYR